jgi:hypothetical protein
VMCELKRGILQLGKLRTDEADVGGMWESCKGGKGTKKIKKRKKEEEQWWKDRQMQIMGTE